MIHLVIVLTVLAVGGAILAGAVWLITYLSRRK